MLNFIGKALLNISLKLLKGEDDIMATVYVSLIIKGLKTFDQVPAKLQDEVRRQLAALELDENGNPLPQE